MARIEEKKWEKRGGKSLTENMIVSRIPPQNLEAEQAVLGAMLLDKSAIVTAEDILRADDFYRDADGIIFEAILNLARNNKEADIVTVTEELRRMGKLDAVGGVIYINGLAEKVFSTKSVGEHAKIVQEKSKLRGLIDAAGIIANNAYNEHDDVQEIVDDAERRILEVAKDDRKSDFVPIGEAVQHALEDINEKFQNKEGVTGLPSGFSKLDGLTSGFQKGDFIITAARPSMGKTAFILNIAKNMSLSSDHKTVAFFSLEMSREQLVQRLLCSTALIDSQKLRTGRITSQEEWRNLAAAAGHLINAPLYIDDTPGISVSESRRLKAERGLDIIMIDYLQLMKGSSKNASDNRQQEISEISRSLKSLARELNVPVIALSQLSRSVESRQDHRPMLSDLRESGSLEQDADMVAFLYREAYYNKEMQDDDEKNNVTEVILAKNRNGPVGTIEMYFAGQFTLFYEMTNQEVPEDM